MVDGRCGDLPFCDVHGAHDAPYGPLLLRGVVDTTHVVGGYVTTSEVERVGGRQDRTAGPTSDFVQQGWVHGARARPGAIGVWRGTKHLRWQRPGSRDRSCIRGGNARLGL